LTLFIAQSLLGVTVASTASERAFSLALNAGGIKKMDFLTSHFVSETMPYTAIVALEYE